MCGTLVLHSCFDLNYKFPEAICQCPNIYPIQLDHFFWIICLLSAFQPCDMKYYKIADVQSTALHLTFWLLWEHEGKQGSS